MKFAVKILSKGQTKTVQREGGKQKNAIIEEWFVLWKLTENRNAKKVSV